MANIELVSLVLTLQPVKHNDDRKPTPFWWGRAAHALLLKIVRDYDPNYVEELHSSNQNRPFTVSTLMGRFPDKGLDPKELYRLRLTVINAKLAEILIKAVQDGPLAIDKIVELDYEPFRICSLDPADIGKPPGTKKQGNNDGTIESKNSHWCGTTGYQDLSAELLLAKTPAPRRITMQFTSPTTFRSKNMNIPLPLPELVFGSLLTRWNEFAPIAFPPEAKRYADECMAIGRYKLSSRTVPMKRGGLRIGAVGEVSYTSLNYDRYWMSVIGVLARFALYAGVGSGTPFGMGQCRLVMEA